MNRSRTLHHNVKPFGIQADVILSLERAVMVSTSSGAETGNMLILIVIRNRGRLARDLGTRRRVRQGGAHWRKLNNHTPSLFNLKAS